MQVTIDDGIVLIGTAHISQKSVDEVKAAIETYKPDVVAVELCQRRYDGITKKDVWENTPVTKLLKSICICTLPKEFIPLSILFFTQPKTKK